VTILSPNISEETKIFKFDYTPSMAYHFDSKTASE